MAFMPSLLSAMYHSCAALACFILQCKPLGLICNKSSLEGHLQDDQSLLTACRMRPCYALLLLVLIAYFSTIIKGSLPCSASAPLRLLYYSAFSPIFNVRSSNVEVEKVLLRSKTPLRVNSITYKFALNIYCFFIYSKYGFNNR